MFYIIEYHFNFGGSFSSQNIVKLQINTLIESKPNTGWNTTENEASQTSQDHCHNHGPDPFSAKREVFNQSNKVIILPLPLLATHTTFEGFDCIGKEENWAVKLASVLCQLHCSTINNETMAYCYSEMPPMCTIRSLKPAHHTKKGRTASVRESISSSPEGIDESMVQAQGRFFSAWDLQRARGTRPYREVCMRGASICGQKGPSRCLHLVFYCI